jgi:hypothetical protein
MPNPNLELLELAAEQLHPFLSEIVFVGGCATGLLIDDPAAAPVRGTYDVDVIAEIGSYAEYTMLADLGANLTISARGYYTAEKQIGSLPHLTGFNELQHQVYARIRHFRCSEEWTLESFLDGLMHKAEFYGISGDLGWAVKSATSAIKRSQ